jgi:16S rRNA (uracil1498-N3)-methyltransferase
MQVFYAPDISGDIHILDEKESKHLVRSLRMSVGDKVKLIDGKGSLYEGIIGEANPKGCIILITRIIKDFEKRDYRLHIAISPLKNADRLEWFIEKSVEIGIDEITPLLCRNTEHRNIREERLNNIIISAMKQSLKATIPKLNNPVRFSEFISHRHNGIKMIAHCSPDSERVSIKNLYRAKNNAVIMIGPEGDFSGDEIREADAYKFASIHLGPSRLRTETAGIAACHSVYLINQ